MFCRLRYTVVAHVYNAYVLQCKVTFVGTPTDSVSNGKNVDHIKFMYMLTPENFKPGVRLVP